MSLYGVFLCTLQTKPKQTLVNELFNSAKVPTVTSLRFTLKTTASYLFTQLQILQQSALGKQCSVKGKCDH